MDLTQSLAVDVLTMAYVGGMPDTFWYTDSRIQRACQVLGVETLQGKALAAEVMG